MLVLMRRRSLLRLEALLALALLGAVTTGLPSHSHEGSETVGIESPDHHGHGVQLVDQGPRVAGVVVAFVAPPAAAVHFGVPPTNAAAPATEAPLPRDRGPPARNRPTDDSALEARGSAREARNERSFR